MMRRSMHSAFRKIFFVFSLVAISICGIENSRSEDANSVLGKWIEKDNDGMETLTEFSAMFMSMTPMKDGKPEGTATKVDVTYRKLQDTQGMGEGYEIDYKPPYKDTWGNDNVIAYVKPSGTVLLDYPGHALHLLKPAP